jgi:site-specific DNA-methyltransferase (adenine-specific)
MLMTSLAYAGTSVLLGIDMRAWPPTTYGVRQWRGRPGVSACVIHGDMLAVLPTLEAESISAVVCDPPYNLASIVKRFGKAGSAPAKHGTDGAFARASSGFMGLRWDSDIAFQPETWAEVLRVMKPGAFMVAFASTRGYHRMVCAIEDAGFVIHPMLIWVTGQGLAKAHRFDLPDMDEWRYGLQALKPAVEPICMAQKPMIGTGAQNWTRYGCGGLHIEACRIETDESTQRVQRGTTKAWAGGAFSGEHATGSDLGRWPANLCHDGSAEVMAAFPAAPGQLADVSHTAPSPKTKTAYGKMNREGEASAQKRYTENGSTNFAVTPGQRRADSGSAARFFYCSKANAKDRAGSKHPTVKPISLLSWLVTLVSPPGGVVLDPFAGSGTTLAAAYRLGFDVIGIEQSAEYVGDIVRRMKAEVRS